MALRILRWVLVLPACYAAWGAALLCGATLLRVAESFCPEPQMISGLCTASWFSPVQAGIFVLSSALAGTLVVASAFLLAPAQKTPVAWLIFGLGGLVALFMGIRLKAWGEIVAAVLSGFTTVRALEASARRSLAPGGTPRG